MRLAISGASGFLGQAVQREAKRRGWEVVPIVRRPMPGAILWDAKSRFANIEDLETVDAVIHLAGESVFGFWTEKKRKTMVESRILSTKLLAKSLATCKHPPKVLVSISAVGYYGDTGEKWAVPSLPPGNTFLGHLCKQWEMAASSAEEVGIRVTHPRLGLVMDPSGGVLHAMTQAFRWGVGAIFGSGEQWISWIGREDAAIALCLAVSDERVQGAWNLVSPEPIRQRVFAKLLADALHRPLWLRIPTCILSQLGGEFARDLLLASCRAEPALFLKQDFPWKTKTIQEFIDFIKV
ncbi:MAG TPA: TIGR01777 family oxidoreductase [Chlamydiales bacterium]|nr:TIGR01777 family oxidoreductase [Chlamydiales bacterium]